jgi:Domain of unknown function (DUF3291)
MHLAQLNIARMLAPADDPIMADFFANVPRINALAEAHKGFVWRLKDEEQDNATSLRPFDDDMLIVNMSVWETPEDLKVYAYQTAHAEIMRRRREWFERMEAYMVLWWIPEGHIPTLEEAKEKLAYLKVNGESEHAFTFKSLK